MSRFSTTIQRILTANRTCGWGKVSQVVRPGEVRLEGRQERVLVAGNASPAIGERVPWLWLDRGTLVTARHIRPRLPWVAPASVGRSWQQTLIADYSGAGWVPQQVHTLWQDDYGRWWATVVCKRLYGSDYRTECYRGDWDDSPWTLAGTLVSNPPYLLGHGNNIFAVYCPLTTYPMLWSRQGQVGADGEVSWSAAVSLPDDMPLIVEARFLHMIHDPSGHLWVHNAPRAGGGSGYAVNYRTYLWRSVLADTIGAGWTLEYESPVRNDGRPVGFLAHNGDRCLLLRGRWNGSPDVSAYQETSANWGGVANTGIIGKRFRSLWADGRWWLTYGVGGSYYATSIFAREGGDGDAPAWGDPIVLANDGQNYRLAVSYADDAGAAAIWATYNQLWRQDLPADEGEGEWPIGFEGVMADAFFPMAVEPGEGGLVILDGSRVWAARMVEA